MPKDSLGDLEFLILLAILRLGEHAYGVSIAEELDHRAGRGLSRATIHVTLRRLEQHRLVLSELGAPRDDRAGKPRRYYQLLPAGIELVRRSKATYSRMWHGLGAVLESSR